MVEISEDFVERERKVWEQFARHRSKFRDIPNIEEMDRMLETEHELGKKTERVLTVLHRNVLLPRRELYRSLMRQSLHNPSDSALSKHAGPWLHAEIMVPWTRIGLGLVRFYLKFSSWRPK